MLRVACFLVLTYVSATIVHAAARRNPGDPPAGFWQGILHGALMPAACPSLAMGRDVTIYAENNAGVPYKLGYTAGVNVCGAIFFGLFFRRLQKMSRKGKDRDS